MTMALDDFLSSNILGPFGVASPETAGTARIPGAISGEFGSTGQILGDPLDIFGKRAGQTSDEVNRLNELALQEALTSQRGQFEETRGLFDPFVEAGRAPLSELTSAITGEGFEFQPSQGFQTGLERGTRGVRRAAAARGLLDSSGTEARLADLVNALTGQEVQGQLQQRLRPVQTAQQAAGIIGGAAGQAAGQGSSAFSNLAQQSLLNAANLGQARQATGQSVAGGLQGLAQLLATQ